MTRLLIQAAYDKGLDQSQELARVVLANKDKFLMEVLYEKEILGKIDVTDAEVRYFYDHLDVRMRPWEIVVEDADTAQVLFERLKSGESFEKLAYEYSIDANARRNKGDLGYVTWGALIDPVQEVLYDMEPGEIAPPIESRIGYHVVRLTDRLPNDRGDFKTMEATIRQQIKQAREREAQVDFFQDMEDKYPIRIDTATCDYLLHKRAQLYPPSLLETLPKNDFDMEQLDRNERELPMATWNGGQMTVYQYLTQSKGIPLNMKPSFDQYDSLALVISALKRYDIIVTEARSRGLDSDPEFKDKVKMFKELNMADLMRNDSIPLPPPPDEGMIRQYYDEHPEEFTDPEQYHVYEILLSDELKAKDLKKRITNLTTFKERALELSERPGKRAISGDLGYIRREMYPAIFDLAKKTPIGKIGGPVVTHGRYSIFWVEDRKEPQLKDFLGMKRQISQVILQNQKRDALAAWLDQRREQTTVTVYEDNLWEIIDMDKYAAADTTGQAG